MKSKSTLQLSVSPLLIDSDIFNKNKEFAIQTFVRLLISSLLIPLEPKELVSDDNDDAFALSEISSSTLLQVLKHFVAEEIKSFEETEEKSVPF